MSDLSPAVWAEMTQHLRSHHSGLSRGWFSQLRPGSLQGGCLHIYANDPAQMVYLNRHCVPAFTEAAQRAVGRLITVDFGLKDGTQSPLKRDHAADPPAANNLRFNGDYLFENFVAGPCNRLAHASCWAVSESPGTAYNPLFIHGGVGLGKTHLLQAICQQILERVPATHILYLTCETFVNHFIDAVEKGRLEGFRDLYRHVDLLVIDDIQFLVGKDRTQEEFFHTFNALYQMDKQIILSADLSPSEIPTLEDRLISRFNWGLVARIDQPCLETRIAILHKKIRLRRLADIPDDVVHFIAAQAQASIRELEGALTRVCGLAAAEGYPITLDLAHTALGDQSPGVPRQVTIEEIMDAVMRQYSVKLAELQGRRRSRSIVFPRQLCMYLARKYTTLSLNEIGGFFGGRDHTTVLHANRLIADRQTEDPTFRARLEAIESILSKPKKLATLIGSPQLS